MAKTIRIVGDEEAWEVLYESPTSMILLNCHAQRRQEVAILEARLEEIKLQLAAAIDVPRTDVSGNAITGP